MVISSKRAELAAQLEAEPADTFKGISKKVLDDAKAHVKALTASWGAKGTSDGRPYGSGGVCKGTCWDLNGKEIVTPHTACHSWVGSAYQASGCANGHYEWSSKYKAGAKNFLTLTCHSKKRSTASEEATNAIILWMASDDSPFAKYILNRDDEDSLTNGGAVILCGPDGANRAQSMWMCKVLRYTTEGSKSLDTWLELYKGGVNPLLAVLIASYVSSFDGAKFSYASVSDHVNVMGGGYIQGDPCVYGLMSFKFNPDAKDTGTVFKADPKDERLLFGKKQDRAVLANKIEGFCKPALKDDGWGGKVVGNAADKAQFLKAVLEWQEELGGYKGAKFPAEASQVVEPVLPMPTSNTVYLDLDL